MENIPHGAIRTIRQAKALIKKAPTTVYRVNDYDDERIWKRKIISNSTIVTGASLFYKERLLPGAKFLTLAYPEGSIVTTEIALKAKQSFLFANYWHAWAYAQKLKQNRI